MSNQLTDSPRKQSTNHLNRELGVYSLAACAAGVTMLALAEPAAGEIVVTNKTIQIPLSELGSHGVGISFANNGVDDLKFVLSNFSIFGSNGESLRTVDATEGKGVLGHDVDRDLYGTPLAMGAKIGASANFVSAACGGSRFSYCGVRLAATLSGGFSSRRAVGPWVGDPKNAYLGVRFLINGETHYGWIRLTVKTTVPGGVKAEVTAYAYETIANKQILAGAVSESAAVQLPQNIAPESAQNQAGPSLGMLALGADALPLWRREELLSSK